VSSPPCTLPSLVLSSGVKGGIAEKAILAQKMTNVDKAEAKAISGSV
jgi:hypothetical protein